jgi:hypothetical protein
VKSPYAIKFASDLRQVGGFLRVLRFPSSIKLTSMIYLNQTKSSTSFDLFALLESMEATVKIIVLVQIMHKMAAKRILETVPVY